MKNVIKVIVICVFLIVPVRGYLVTLVPQYYGGVKKDISIVTIATKTGVELTGEGNNSIPFKILIDPSEGMENYNWEGFLEHLLFALRCVYIGCQPKNTGIQDVLNNAQVEQSQLRLKPFLKRLGESDDYFGVKADQYYKERSGSKLFSIMVDYLYAKSPPFLQQGGEEAESKRTNSETGEAEILEALEISVCFFKFTDSELSAFKEECENYEVKLRKKIYDALSFQYSLPPCQGEMVDLDIIADNDSKDKYDSSSISEAECASFNRKYGWVSKPLYPVFTLDMPRLNTYNNSILKDKNWDSGLNRAGFFHTGVDDVVTCFFCGISLCNWESKYDPRGVHANYSGDCGYVSLCGFRKYLSENGYASDTPIPETVRQLYSDDVFNCHICSIKSPKNKSTRYDKVSARLEEYFLVRFIDHIRKDCFKAKCFGCENLKYLFLFCPCMHLTCGECRKGHAAGTCPVCDTPISSRTAVLLVF